MKKKLSNDPTDELFDTLRRSDDDTPITLTADELDNIVSDVEDQNSEEHIDDSLSETGFETVTPENLPEEDNEEASWRFC